MKKVMAIIERGNNGTYGVYIDNNPLSYGVLGDGNTVEEAKEDFYNSYEEMKQYYKEEGKEFQEAEFEFKYDVASFLAYYSTKLSLAGLQRITGINQGQLSHYLTGHRNPSERTIKKIQDRIHDFAKELSDVHFV